MLVNQNENVSVEEHKAILDYLELRKEGRIQTILCDSGAYYVVENDIAPFGEKERISKKRFIQLVELAKVGRMEVGSETETSMCKVWGRRA